MKCFSPRVVAAVLAVGVVMSAAQTASANSFANPGFEDPVTTDGPAFRGLLGSIHRRWLLFRRTARIMPRTGAQHLELFINNLANGHLLARFRTFRASAPASS